MASAFSIGRNSAVGNASAISLTTRYYTKRNKSRLFECGTTRCSDYRNTGAPYSSDMYRSIFFRSLLQMPPMGFRSADEQSYFVMYPRSASSTFELPRTSKKPLRPLTQLETNVNRKPVLFFYPVCIAYIGILTERVARIDMQ